MRTSLPTNTPATLSYRCADVRQGAPDAALETYLEFIQHFREAIELRLVPRGLGLFPQGYSSTLATSDALTDWFYLCGESIQIDE